MAAMTLACIISVAVLSSCSSLPKKGSGELLARKNEAAGFSKQGDTFMASGQYPLALQSYGKALEVNLAIDNVPGTIGARSSLGRVYLALAMLEDAEREFLDALEDARAFGQGPLTALCLSNLGELRYAAGLARADPSAATAADSLFVEAEGLAGADEALAAVLAHNRGIVAMARGDHTGAEALLLKSAASNEKARRWAELGSNRYALASVANALGNLPLALDRARAALDADKNAENSRGIGADLEALARLSRKAGQDGAAFDYYRRAFGVWLSLDQPAEAERCLIALGELSAILGKEYYARRYAELLERFRNR